MFKFYFIFIRSIVLWPKPFSFDQRLLIIGEKIVTNLNASTDRMVLIIECKVKDAHSFNTWFRDKAANISDKHRSIDFSNQLSRCT